MNQNVLLQLLDLILNPVSDKEIVIDHKVNQQVKEPVRLVHFLFPKYRFDGAELADLLLGYSYNIMPSQEYA
ncbi:hypothetical protein D3C73_418790 [compost metagenome]